MLISYYKNPNYTYASRKRYAVLPTEDYLIGSEEQRAVKLGDGANTSVKTSVNNICDYVTIGTTRWFVHHYIYLNGGQIQLFLQRDVIGEYGISSNDMYGKIERGYTDSILKYRKELDLNQILKKRIPLLPDNEDGLKYLNYKTNTHNKEMWAILYLIKNSEGKIDASINIPAFKITVDNLESVSSGNKYITNIKNNIYFTFQINSYIFEDAESQASLYENLTVTLNYSVSGDLKNVTYNGYTVNTYTYGFEESIKNVRLSNILSHSYANFVLGFVGTFAYYLGDSTVRDKIVNNYLVSFVNNFFVFPNNVNSNKISQYNNSSISSSYDGAIVEEENDSGDTVYYKYTLSYDNSTTLSGAVQNISNTASTAEVTTWINNNLYGLSFTTAAGATASISNAGTKLSLAGTDWGNDIVVTYTEVTKTEITGTEAGIFAINYSEQLLDEPYVILAAPIYDCTITSTDGSVSYTVEKKTASNIINSVIEYLSGESSYLADAQIIPYAPDLSEVALTYQNLPFFGISSSYFSRDISVDLLPYSDIKKEYIKRQYSIVAPDQSDKFSFNFYDYVPKVTELESDTTYNSESLDIRIKVALKPYSVISSAVILSKQNTTELPALMGIQYPSDLRGCQPNNSGFEKSISTNQFEEYERTNSNYQQIFAKNQEYLALQNQTEHINDVTSAVVNTVSSATMGAIAGATIGQNVGGGLANALSGGAASTTGALAGAVSGAAIAGTATGVAMGYQVSVNDTLRNYEYNMQQELFDLEIGTIKNLPNTLSRVSSFNEIILQDFYYVLEVYECSNYESSLVDTYIEKYGYGIGAYGYLSTFWKEGWFLRADLITSSLPIQLHEIANKELKAGIYYYGS